MGETKDISMKNYQWSHFGAILFDVILGSIIIRYTYGRKDRRGSFYVGVILVLFSLLGLIPVFQDYEKIVIS